MSVWLQAWMITETTQKGQALEVVRCLENVNRELDLVRKGMNQATFSSSLYENAISAFEEAASPMLLPHTWSSVRQYLTPQNIISLEYCSEILPDEEALVPSDELSEILGLVSELRDAANSENIPAILKAIMLHHVELIEKAIASYPITGVKALKVAVQTGIGELYLSKNVVIEHKNTPELSKLAEVWEKVSDAADTALKLDKLVQVSQRAWNFIETICNGA
jgi:hypothetical protein